MNAESIFEAVNISGESNDRAMFLSLLKVLATTVSVGFESLIEKHNHRGTKTYITPTKLHYYIIIYKTCHSVTQVISS